MIVIHLVPRSPRESSDIPDTSASNVNGILFSLAPSKVYIAAVLPQTLVSSYLTVSALPFIYLRK